MYVEKSILIDLGPNCWGKEKRNWAKIDIIDTVSEKVLNSLVEDKKCRKFLEVRVKTFYCLMHDKNLLTVV